MTHLTAVVTLLGADNVDEQLRAQLASGPLTFETLSHLGSRVTPSQMVQIHTGVNELRRAFSSQLLTELIVRRISADTLARADVASEEARQRLENGGVLIELPAMVDFEGTHVVGRPDATAMDDAFKRALGQAVARIVRLATVADGDEYKVYERARSHLSQRLQTHAALFNFNAHHKHHHEFPVLNWCETHGPTSLARAYGLGEGELEAALDAAFRDRLRRNRFETVLADELRRIEILLAWADAHIERKRAEKGRRDSTRRMLKKQELDWQTAPGKIEPPRMHAPVRRNLVAARAMAQLTPRAMVEAAILFDLEPVYPVFLTRLYLLPVLAAAGLAGRVGLRRQLGEITSPITAGGLVALADERGFANDDVTGLVGEDEDEDGIGAHQALVETMFERSGVSVADLADRGREFLRSGRPVAVDPPAGPRRFFLDD